MTRINLLPWRDELRKLRQEEFIISIILVLIVVVAIVFSMGTYLDGQIAEQQDMQRIVNAREAGAGLITNKIKDIKTQSELLQKKRNVIQALQKNRPEIVHFMDAIARVVPKGVFLSKIKQENVQVELTGKTQSSAQVSAFMRNVKANSWLMEPELSIIKRGRKNKKGQLSEFTLYAKQRQSNAEDEDI